MQISTNSNQISPIAKKTRIKNSKLPLLKPTKITSTNISALDKETINELINKLATKILDTRIAITPQYFFILNLIFISALIAKIQNICNKIATIIYFNNSRKTTKILKNNKEYKTSAAILKIKDEKKLEIREKKL